MATNENVNKVIYGNQTVMDITDTTAEESDVASGEVFYKANGARSVGTLNKDSAVWGNISGTLSDQNDLQIELNRAYTKTASETSSIDDLDVIPVQKISASSDGRRNIKFKNLKSILKTYFDAIYSTFSGSYNDLTNKPTAGTGIAINNNIIAVDADNTPTKNSEKPVKSKGVYSALESNRDESTSLLRSTVGWTGKNLLKRTSNSNKTIENITFTVNADNSITCNGTASNSLVWIIESVLCKANKEYILTGCPSGGGSESTNYWLGAYVNGTISKRDTGNGVTLKYTTDTTVEVRLRIPSGYVANNFTFYPMIRDASITDDTYEPYHESVEEEIEQIYADNGVLGAKNLLKIFNMSYSGIDTFVNLDGSITSRGTKASSGGSNFRILEPNKFMLPIGKYKLSLSGTPADKKLRLSLAPSTGDWITKATVTNGNEVEFEITSADLDKTISMFFVPVEAGTVIDWTYYPMLRLASDPDDTYVPYAMTNRKLTEELTPDSFIIGQTGCTLQVVKYGKIVEIRRNSVSSLTADTDTIVGQLPVGYRPKGIVASYNTTHDGNKCKIQVGSDGNVMIRSSNTNYFLPICLTFIAEQ